MNDFLQVPVWNDTYSLLLPLSISVTVQLADLDIVTNCYKPTVSLGSETTAVVQLASLLSDILEH